MAEELPPLEEFEEHEEYEELTETSPEYDSEQSTASIEWGDDSARDGLDVGDLGYYLDGWADLIENKGDQAAKIYNITIDILSQRFPVTSVNQHFVNSSKVVHDSPRAYLSTTNRPGATTTIYVGARGDDLYISWRTYIKPVLRTMLLLIIVGVGGFFGLLASDGEISSTTFVVIASAVILVELIGLAVSGQLQKGDMSAYFYEEPTILDAEDITAMSMAAHKSLQRALDKEGIDVKQLRLKQNFSGGRRGETL